MTKPHNKNPINKNVFFINYILLILFFAKIIEALNLYVPQHSQNFYPSVYNSKILCTFALIENKKHK